jgi:hypothetical protein
MTDTLYDRDFYAWIYHNISLLKAGKISEINQEILIDELESMAKRDKRELISRFIILIAHLLRWQYQINSRSYSWKGSIAEQRFQIIEQLEESPSLQNNLLESIQKAYPKAVKIASAETNLVKTIFPLNCPYTLDNLIDGDFYAEK